MVKKKICVLLVLSFIALSSSIPAEAAFDDTVVGDTAVSIVMPISGKAYIVDPSTKVESFTVNDDSIDFRVTTGSVLLLQSADKSAFITSGDSTCSTIVTVCAANFSSLSVRCTNPMGDSGTHVLKVTPTGTCTPPDAGGARVSVVAERVSSGTSGGNFSASPFPLTPAPSNLLSNINPEPSIPVLSSPPKTLPVSQSVKKLNSNFKFTLYLKPGTKGVEAKRQIAELQLRLQKLGYFPAKTKPNGVYGPTTTEAVKKYQKAKAIKEVYLGPKTRTALNK